MRITAVLSYPVWIGHRNQMLVKIETDAGHHGWGEAGLSGRERAVAGAVEHYAEWLVGRDPRAIGALWQEMYRSQYFEGGRVLTAAISAIDIALHDLKGKALGVPVHELLGGRHRDRVPTFATVAGSTADEIVASALALQAAGWDAIRVFPLGEAGGVFEPRRSIALTVPLVLAVRAALGPGAVLGIDYHHRLSPAEAASFCQRLPPGTLDFIEEPIRDETPEAYEALRRLTAVPFAIGEEFASKWQFLPYVERGIHAFNRIDVSNVGGLTEAMKVAGWSEAHYVDLMPHNPLGPVCTAATVALAAAVPNLAWVEVWHRPPDPEADAIFPVQPRLEGTAYPVGDAPGLGVEVDEDRVAVEAFRFWEAPHWRRDDGSVTNW